MSTWVQHSTIIHIAPYAMVSNSKTITSNVWKQLKCTYLMVFVREWYENVDDAHFVGRRWQMTIFVVCESDGCNMCYNFGCMKVIREKLLSNCSPAFGRHKARRYGSCKQQNVIWKDFFFLLLFVCLTIAMMFRAEWKKKKQKMYIS